jgi:hypothetical protein
MTARPTMVSPLTPARNSRTPLIVKLRGGPAA